MARHSQDVASPQLSTTPTIVSPPRSSRSPSLSQVIVKSKPLVIPTRSQHSISNLNLPRNSPPPDFLLDDDPFANLTGFGSGGKVCRQATPGDKHSPRSRLVNNDNNYEPLPELDEGPSQSSYFGLVY
jgi:hypothetical protein